MPVAARVSASEVLVAKQQALNTPGSRLFDAVVVQEGIEGPGAVGVPVGRCEAGRVGVVGAELRGDFALVEKVVIGDLVRGSSPLR